MQTSDTYKQRMIKRLKKCCTEIHALDVIAVNADADAKVRYIKELDVLHAKKREAAKKIQELEDASGEAWEAVMLSAEEVWDDLGIGLALAIYKFK